MSTTPIPTTPVTAQPIDTLAELRRQNSALLQRDVAGAGTSRPRAGELLGFLEAAANLGRSLEDIDARETAQGIMDVWIAALLSSDPNAANGSRPFTLESFDESRAHLAADEAKQQRQDAVVAAQRAQNVLPSSPQLDGLKKSALTRFVEFMPTWMQPILFCITGREADADISLRVLLRFIRLKENSLEAYAVPVAENDDIFRDAKTKDLIQRLAVTGVVKRQASPDSASATYVLAHDSLIMSWPLLNEFVRQRKAFRELARGWENGGRQTAALLHSGAQLEQAIDFPHLDTLETAFLEASRRAGESDRRWAFSVAATALVVLAGLVVWLTLANTQLTKARADLQQSLAVSKTTHSPLLSLDDLLDSGRTLPESMPAPVRVSVQSILTEFRAKYKSDQKRSRVTDSKGGTSPTASSRGMVELFVSLQAGGSEKAIAYIDALKKANLEVPAGCALPRRGIPDKDSASEVRYFDADDEGLANEVMSVLKTAGLTTKVILDPHLMDKDAPKHFIQVALSEGTLVPSGRP